MRAVPRTPRDGLLRMIPAVAQGNSTRDALQKACPANKDPDQIYKTMQRGWSPELLANRTFCDSLQCLTSGIAKALPACDFAAFMEKVAMGSEKFFQMCSMSGSGRLRPSPGDWHGIARHSTP